jgi:outer membrane protein assembly factor BamE (lipoprotein component of BamABCDE complex)
LNLEIGQTEVEVMKTPQKIVVTAIAALLTAGCTATHHAAGVREADDVDRLTVGTVQKEIVIGMSAADVAAALGSPNIVTTEEERQETWIYDKISSDVTYSRSSGSVVGLIFGGSGGGAGVGTTSAGASSSSQRTLTVVIKFDGDSRVRDFSYHTSRF